MREILERTSRPAKKRENSRKELYMKKRRKVTITAKSRKKFAIKNTRRKFTNINKVGIEIEAIIPSQHIVTKHGLFKLYRISDLRKLTKKITNGMWVVKRDQSLNEDETEDYSGFEFVTSGHGIKLYQAKIYLNALNKLFNYINRRTTRKIYFSENTGLHIHVSTKKPLNAIQTSYLLKNFDEKAMYKIFGEHREIYAGPSNFLKEDLGNIDEVLVKKRMINVFGFENFKNTLGRMINCDTVSYALIGQKRHSGDSDNGIYRISKCGTIEFRHATIYRFGLKKMISITMSYLKYVVTMIEESTEQTVFNRGGAAYTIKNKKLVVLKDLYADTWKNLYNYLHRKSNSNYKRFLQSIKHIVKNKDCNPHYNTIFCILDRAKLL